LETGPIPPRFFLSSKACQGILRRAEKRGKTLPPQLAHALRAAADSIVHAIQAGALRTNPASGPDGVGVQEGIAYTLEARSEVQAVCVTGNVTHSLTAEGHDASEDGSGRGAPIVAFVSGEVMPINTQVGLRHEALGERTGLGIGKDGDPAFTLSKSHSHAVFAQTVAIRGRDGGATAELGGEVATALRASQGGGDKPHVLTSAVRRLTPTECERLQGFPDGYTDIPWRGKPTSPDGPRYKALGNSWAVPKFAWLGERIQRLMPKEKPAAANDNDGVRNEKMAG
jgi:DNA (cytosine-5)-methyltransferase 1